MSTQESGIRYELVFESLIDDEAETLRRVKTCLVGECGVEIPRVQEILEHQATVIKQSLDKTDLQKLEMLLLTAGARVIVKESEGAESPSAVSSGEPALTLELDASLDDVATESDLESLNLQFEDSATPGDAEGIRKKKTEGAAPTKSEWTLELADAPEVEELVHDLVPVDYGVEDREVSGQQDTAGHTLQEAAEDDSFDLSLGDEPEGPAETVSKAAAQRAEEKAAEKITKNDTTTSEQEKSISEDAPLFAFEDSSTVDSLEPDASPKEPTTKQIEENTSSLFEFEESGSAEPSTPTPKVETKQQATKPADTTLVEPGLSFEDDSSVPVKETPPQQAVTPAAQSSGSYSLSFEEIDSPEEDDLTLGPDPTAPADEPKAELAEEEQAAEEKQVEQKPKEKHHAADIPLAMVGRKKKSEKEEAKPVEEESQPQPEPESEPEPEEQETQGAEEEEADDDDTRKVFGLPQDLVVSLVVGIAVLGAANFYFFSSGNESENATHLHMALMQSQMSKKKVKKVKKETEEGETQVFIEEKTGDFEGEATFERDTYTIAVDVQGSRKGLKSLSVGLVMNESPSLDPEQIVTGQKRAPWISKLNFERFEFQEAEEGVFLAEGKGKGYFRQEDDNGRILGTADVEGVMQKDGDVIKLKVRLVRTPEKMPKDASWPVVRFEDGEIAFLFEDELEIPLTK